MKYILLLDIDGCVANVTHLLYLISNELKTDKKDFEQYYKRIGEAKPIEEGLILYHALLNELSNDWEQGEAEVYVLTGRSERSRKETEKWLGKYFNGNEYLESVYMRKDGDERPSDVVKQEMLLSLKNKYPNALYIAVDDERRVRKMYRKHGVFVLQPHHESSRSS